MESVLDRLLRYVAVDTQSDESSETCPSTAKQKNLGNMLVAEMLAMGIKDAHMDENGYIYGTVPGDPSYPTIGLISHMDTAPDLTGTNVKPRVVLFDGTDIALNDQYVLGEKDFPNMAMHHGKHLVVTDGNTLLGADDKAGVAEILTAAEYLLTHDEPHATLRIGFTPDEEIGRGANRFNVKEFGADFAYTADGGTIGEIEYENFNAAGARVVFKGRSIHPGSAKDKMINSQLLAMEFFDMLPVHQRAESTEGTEGFFLLTSTQGGVEETTCRYIIRDHDMEKFQQKKAMLQKIADFLNDKYGDGSVTLTVTDQYYNMKEKIQPVIHIVEHAMKAMAAVGMNPVAVPVRGGTDGARLSYMGLPCPNLCTGGDNFHGRYEYIPVEDMEVCTQMLVKILTMK